MTAAAARGGSRAVVAFDPVRDKRYAATRLGRDVADFLAWMDLGGASQRTLDQYERDLARGALMFPDKGMADITDGDMLHIARSFSVGQRRVRMAAWKTFYKWGRQSRRVTVNPTDALPDMRRQAQPVIDVFTDAETAALCALPSPHGWLMAVLFDGGLRKSEARHLRMKRCRIETRELVIREGAKGGRDRMVPMSDRLLHALTDYQLLDGLNPNDYLWFNRPGGGRIRRDRPVGEASFHRWWVGCLDRAGVDYRRPHVARHTFATNWRRRGLTIDEIQILLGHSSIRTTSDLYVHTRVEDVKARMAAIEASE